MADGSMVYVIGGEEGDRARCLEALRGAGFATSSYARLERLAPEAMYGGPSCVCIYADSEAPDEAGQAFRRYGGRAPVLVLLGEADLNAAVEWMRHGAADVVAPPYDGLSLTSRVRRVLQGDGRECVRRKLRRRILERMETLTRREREVMRLVVRGRSNKRIAAEIGVSIKTVEVHRSRVMRKMEAGSLAQLVADNIEVGFGVGASEPVAGDAGAVATGS